MKITFDTWNQNPVADKSTTLQSASTVVTGHQTGAYALDISGTVMDNNAYGDHGRSTKDVMQSFEAQPDISVQRDYMTVMSNILSTEDFNKMMEGGFDPSKLDPEQVVTIVDHIKATMAQAGQVVSGYNDDMDADKLREIVGDAGLAKEIEQACKGANLPVNEENIAALQDSLEKAAGVSQFDEAGKKYMVENHLKPTVENFYRAGFSASGDGNRQSRGYYAQEMRGYFAKKADIIDWKAMQPQLEHAIHDMNLKDRTMEQALEQAKWLVEKGIPVTRESMQTLGEVESVNRLLEPENVIAAGVNALLEGKQASEGRLSDASESIYEKAVRYQKEVTAITQDAVKETLSAGEDITLQNLYAAQMQLNVLAGVTVDASNGRSEFHGKNTFHEKNASGVAIHTSVDIEFSREKYVTASRQLAEVQLRMTIDANIKLLKSDYAIDTAPLSELVEALREQEQQLAKSFFGSEHSDGIAAKTDLFSQTRNTLEELPYLPAAVVGKITYAKSVSLSRIHEEGVALRAQYVAANERYETLMTSPRADMGDSIRKAFRNVNDILQDMKLDLTEDNQKAVRILGYNSMEITPEAVKDVKDMYLQVEDVIRSMTPQRTLSMIRDGVNPLTMELSELEDYLHRLDRTPEEESTKYSRFLYELEKNGQINEGEREAYIGVYRLFHQIEKSDGAVIGSLMAQGADLTLGNLLTAVRNRKASNMDYTIDDSFGTLSEKTQNGKSISGQIERGIREARIAHSIFRDLSVDALQHASIHEQTTLEQLKDAFSQTGEQPWSEDMVRDALLQFRQDTKEAADVEEIVLSTMKQRGIDFTTENLLAVNGVLTEKGKLAREVKEAAKQLDKKEGKDSLSGSSVLEGSEEELLQSFTDYDAAQAAMERWENCVENTIQDAVSKLAYTSKDVKNFFMDYKQLSVIRSMRQSESYEIPMEIAGEMTSVNLTFLRGAEEKGTVSIAMDTKAFGKAGVKFHVQANRIESYFVADSEMGKERLKNAGEAILQSLEKQGMEVGDTHYVNAHAQGRKEWNLLTFSFGNDDKDSETVATAQLYKIAKTFLDGIQTTI